MSAYLDLIFLGVVVLLILFRLNNVLGTRPEQPQIKIVSKKEFEKIYDIIQNKVKEEERFCDIKLPQTPADETLRNIPNFNKADFLKRVSKVFEMVLDAFANRDNDTLKMLTTPKLYEKFSEVLEQRKEQNLTLESDLIKIDEMEITDAKISAKGVAQITVKFVSDQINVLKDDKGEIIEGDENFVQKITDMWTFEKDINKSTPVWRLNSTKKK